MTGLRLRPYQEEALEAIGRTTAQRSAVVLPTGMGKTVIFAELVRRNVQAGIVPMILVHRDELVRQTVAKLHGADPDMRVGVVKGPRNEAAGASVIVASVQTLARPNRRAAVLEVASVGLVIVDECHHAASKSYLDVLTAFGCFSTDRLGQELLPTVHAVGFTATMSREDDRKLGDVWQEVVYERDILYGIEHGYLTDVRGRSVTVDGLDLGTVARTAGDYQDGSLGDALEASGAGEVIADAYREHASLPDGTLRRGVVFAPTVASAISFATDFDAAGIGAEVITGDTPVEDRQLAYKRVRAGDSTVLVNCMVLTEGFDMPELSCAVIARPTSSIPLYVQMVGRVLRPYPGKHEALVLDVMGVAGRLKLASITDLTKSEVPVGEDESIREAKDRKEREETVKRGKFRGGKIDSAEVDLFGASKSAWLRTRGGVFFIATRHSTWFLWPDEPVVSEDGVSEAWRVGRCGLYSSKGGEWLQTGMPIEYAMAWAEEMAQEEDSSIASRSSSWRRTKASPAQVEHAMKLRLPEGLLPDIRRGALSDAISTFYASKILDRRGRA